MKTYITRTGQNIYDIALQLYGSIEGVIDLLICNPSIDIADYGPSELKGQPLSFNTHITRGIILKYHESLVFNDNIREYLEDKKIYPTNGEHSCDAHNFLQKKKRIIIHQTGVTSIISGQVGDGTLYIDWGDFSDIKTIKTDNGPFAFEHVYKSSDEHTIVLMGDFDMESLDLSHCNGIAYPLNQINIYRTFTNNNTVSSINALFNIQEK